VVIGCLLCPCSTYVITCVHAHICLTCPHMCVCVCVCVQGWVDVDKFTLQHVKYPNVFALGDSRCVCVCPAHFHA
jgi:hypothetical protein